MFLFLNFKSQISSRLNFFIQKLHDNPISSKPNLIKFYFCNFQFWDWFSLAWLFAESGACHKSMYLNVYPLGLTRKNWLYSKGLQVTNTLAYLGRVTEATKSFKRPVSGCNYQQQGDQTCLWKAFYFNKRITGLLSIGRVRQTAPRHLA